MSRIVGLQKCEVNKFSAEKRRNGTERNVEHFIRVSEYHGKVGVLNAV